ncbi:MAG: NAD-dependent epimerase/dehydratase family protein [Myxococcales bacterium]|jgi:UDP-2-acetamido-2,6-beta-L-arabino-hexul-4-ose reductase|nr:NAD-dependent epimerase/dehydratase family protein [Myxococcales bacterium]
MKLLVTGAAGFIGQNLVATLRARRPDDELLLFDRENTRLDLDEFTSSCDFVFHLAGVNRPRDPAQFIEGNLDLTRALVESLDRHGNAAPVLMTSSTQAALDNPYGQSKRAAEETLLAHARGAGSEVFVYRLPNAFGKLCRPNYNSAIATFCHNAAHGLAIDVHEPDRHLTLAYIDDILDEFLRALDGLPTRSDAFHFCEIPITHEASVGALAHAIQGFEADRRAGVLSDRSDPLIRKLYATYLSHLPVAEWRTKLDMKSDARGSFTEFLRLGGSGQVSVNVTKPGITKGKHWHHTKSEKFLVVSGKGRIRLRPISGTEVIVFDVSGKELEIIEIPVGHTHDITNVGDSDLITVMWASEPFDPARPDTYLEEV